MDSRGVLRYRLEIWWSTTPQRPGLPGPNPGGAVLELVALLIEAVIRDSCGSATPGRGLSTGTDLTPCEQSVLEGLADGLSAQVMASQRGVSVRTVRKHLEHVYSKLHCHDRLTAVLGAQREGILDHVTRPPGGQAELDATCRGIAELSPASSLSWSWTR